MVKKFLIVLMIYIFILTGCSEESSIEDISTEDFSGEAFLLEEYDIGDEIELGGVKFNIYKISDDANELYLLAQNNLVTTIFSADDREQKYKNNYEGSLVEGYVNKFVDDLEDKGLVIKESGIIDKDDLCELGFDSDGLNGTQYKINDAPDFLRVDEHFWVDGYCKYDTYAWAYSNRILTTQPCDDEYGVRPVIVIQPSEIDKQIEQVDPNLTIKEVVNANSAWTSEGGISNPYDRFYFDLDNMLFINVFESSELSATCEFSMEFVDEKTIRVNGFRLRNEQPVELTIVNENKLRVRFLDDEYNDGDYYLNKVND